MHVCPVLGNEVMPPLAENKAKTNQDVPEDNITTLGKAFTLQMAILERESSQIPVLVHFPS